MRDRAWKADKNRRPGGGANGWPAARLEIRELLEGQPSLTLAFAVKAPAYNAWLRLVALTILIWFGPSILVLQQVSSWAEFKTLWWFLPVFPGLVLWQIGGALLGRLPSADSLVFGALITVAFVASTLALAYRCQERSSEWLPLLGAFVVSCWLWWGASAMVAA